MPKNKGKGGKSRRRGKGEGDTRRELTRKMEGTEYAKVSKMLGGLHLEAVCMDGRTRQCRIPGSLRRRVWIGAGDIVLVGLRGALRPLLLSLLRRSAARAVQRTR